MYHYFSFILYEVKQAGQHGAQSSKKIKLYAKSLCRNVTNLPVKLQESTAKTPEIQPKSTKLQND